MTGHVTPKCDERDQEQHLSYDTDHTCHIDDVAFYWLALFSVFCNNLE